MFQKGLFIDEPKVNLGVRRAGMELFDKYSWDSVFKTIRNGRYKEVYNIGDMIPLQLTTYGTVNMQIAGFDVDTLASDSTKKAHISWISEKAITTHRMNPNLSYSTDTVDAFVENPTNTWISQNRYIKNSAEATWTITPTESGTFTIQYKTNHSYPTRHKIQTLSVDGVTIASDYGSTTTASYSVTATAGEPIIINCVVYNNHTTYNYYATLIFSGISFSTSVEMGTTKRRGTANPGTGSLGGWENSEIRTWLKSTVKSKLPTDIQNSIIEVIKQQTAYDNSQTSFNQTTYDDIWIPSQAELSNGLYYDLFLNTNANRIKSQIGSSTAQYYWLRNATGSGQYYQGVETDGSFGSHQTAMSQRVVIGFCI